MLLLPSYFCRSSAIFGVSSFPLSYFTSPIAYLQTLLEARAIFSHFLRRLTMQRHMLQCFTLLRGDLPYRSILQLHMYPPFEAKKPFSIERWKEKCWKQKRFISVTKLCSIIMKTVLKFQHSREVYHIKPTESDLN